MDIVFFRHSLLSRGGDKMIAVYANHLAASGHQVTIKTNIVDTVFTLDERISVQALRFPGKLGSILSALLEKSSSDIIIGDIIAMVCLLSLHNRNKLVCFAQDYDESYYTNILQKLFIRLLYFLVLTLLKVRTIAVSNRLGDHLHSRFNADVSVVENGIDTNIFYFDPNSELVSKKGERKAVLLHSRTDYRKGFDIAVKMISKLVSQSTTQFEVWTVGVPVQGLFSDCVHRDFGYVGETDLRRIMSSADIFLYPSRHEGLPLMPLEAMACGCAVVTTTAVPFAIHEENALVAQIEDIESLTKYLTVMLTDDQQYIRLVEAGKLLVNRHKLSAAARQFEMILSTMRRKETFSSNEQ